ncbi:MAG: hypothetical protein K2N29_06230 [Ruminiclostridium sp.]|nr:hypothetical protein [Ruminiclostridium sp.]
MTTVTIGTYPKIPVTEKNAERLPEAEELPFAEKAKAPVPAQNQEEELSEPEESEGVRAFSSPASARRGIPLRAVFVVRLLLAAGAGLFVWLGGMFGSEELRAAIAETVQRVLNG